VANAGTNTISVISDSTNAIISDNPISVGSNPIAVTYDPDKGEIFVANFAGNSVSVISDSTNAVVATIPVGNSPIAVTYDSGKGEIFVANTNANSVSVISDIINTVSTSGGPVTATNVAGNPTATYAVGSSIQEFPIVVVALVALIGTGIYIVIRYKKRVL
jgi:YVTN family beta-propeller protein